MSRNMTIKMIIPTKREINLPQIMANASLTSSKAFSEERGSLKTGNSKRRVTDSNKRPARL